MCCKVYNRGITLGKSRAMFLFFGEGLFLFFCGGDAVFLIVTQDVEVAFSGR